MHRPDLTHPSFTLKIVPAIRTDFRPSRPSVALPKLFGFGECWDGIWEFIWTSEQYAK